MSILLTTNGGFARKRIDKVGAKVFLCYINCFSLFRLSYVGHIRALVIVKFFTLRGRAFAHLLSTHTYLM